MAAEANEPKRLTQKQLDDIVKGQVELESAMLFGQAQQQMNLQNSVASMMGMSGASDPLQGLPRDRPYWESMFGNLGMQDTLFHQRKGGK